MEKRLKDVLEDKVDEKYYLSDKAVEGFLKNNENLESKVGDDEGIDTDQY